MINRDCEKTIIDKLFKGKVIIVFGPRQSGKTTLVKHIFDNIDVKKKWFNADEPDIRISFTGASSTQLKNLAGNAQLIVIDEAQRIENIGLVLKLIVDNFPEIQVIATGSSAFELADRINEPLTGRKWEFKLFPFSYSELSNHFGLLEEKRMLEQRLVFGSYPEIVLASGNHKSLLNQLSDSYLYKDILALENVKKTDKLENLLRALAFQIGSEVSFNELAKIVGLDNQTIEKYILLLEKSFIIFRLGSFSRNLRSELKKSRKIYFFDNGIRNSIINNFNSVEMRDDIGALWENYIISERLKFTHYNEIFSNKYFWRTIQQQEIDYLEEREGKIFAYEIKWKSIKKNYFSKTFTEAYTNSNTQFITKDNYSEFLTEK
jgi:predicted AAA+ superfamily ATPase